MASNFHLYERLFSELDGALGPYINDVASSIIGAITPVATTLITIYVMLWGWSMLRGMISEPITDGISRIVRLAVITSIALSLGYYNGFLSNWLWRSPDALAGYVSSGYGNATTNAQFLDNLVSQIYDVGDAYWTKANVTSGGLPFPDFGLLAVALLIWIGGILATGYGAFLLALSKMALAIILGVGPIFVLLTLFEPTKRFFDAWIGQALNYVFLVMLTAAAIKLILTILQTYMTDASGAGVFADPSISQAFPCIVLCAIGTLVMMQLPSIASALGGGVAIGTLGAVGWTFDKARGGLSAIRPTNLRRAYLKATSDVRIVRNSAGTTARAPLAIYRKITGANRNRIAQD